MTHIYYNGKVFTGDENLQQAFVVENKKFIYVGNNEEALKYKDENSKLIDLDEKLEYTYTYYNDGTGLVKESPVGTLYTVRDLIKYTIVNSDNIAYNFIACTGANTVSIDWGLNTVFLNQTDLAIDNTKIRIMLK